MNRVWFITGASRGLGKEYVEIALANGDKVAAAARNAAKITQVFGENENLLPIQLDVTKQEQMSPAVQATLDAFGRIDILVNNAGYAIFGALEEVSDKEIRDLFDTCVFGVLNMSRAVIPVMRQQASGRIINVSSKAGLIGDPGDVAYNAAKFAVDGASEGMSKELADWGIQVMSLCPGSFRTDFRDSSVSLREPANIMEEYNGKLVHVAMDMSRAHQHDQIGDPKKAAKLIYEVATSERMPFKLLNGY